MAVFTVEQGKRYRAEIALRFYERIVSNETIESRLREAGFTDVRVGEAVLPVTPRRSSQGPTRPRRCRRRLHQLPNALQTH